MRVLELPRHLSPREQGIAHGESFRPLISELAAIRIELCMSVGRFKQPADVLAVAKLHLPVLEKFDRALYEELLGVAEGAAVAPELIVVLNHYTDLRDLDPQDFGHGSARDHVDDCSVIYARTRDATLLGQTWDMHGSAMPYVMMLKVPQRSLGSASQAERDETPATWCLSIVGCFGMAGLNEHGVGVTINNLNSLDAKLGVVWPALVRRALYERSAEAARDVIVNAPLGSGHHYFVASAGRGFGIETSGTRKDVVFSGDGESYFHTNHCLSKTVGEVSTIAKGSTTKERYAAIEAGMRTPVADLHDLWRRLGSHEGYPKSVCSHMASPAVPHAGLTCGAIAMDLDHRLAWAAQGCVHHARAHLFHFEER